ncbi:hypothetical protein BDV24DRAFT_121015 [Aspergillus arachidicola]|uniref:Uncharacterized protein n=1 Tax=Aspergillus arachidicola TaxID=656916 RepID=A0A5N6YQ54_9EURO|nr:hypothetical protein BDV24DRAFT_121015 [Aspergillus arachidicola]
MGLDYRRLYPPLTLLDLPFLCWNPYHGTQRMANISLDYLVTCAPTQVHTHQQSSILPLPLKEFPPALRLIREDGSIFYINLMECSTWFVSGNEPHKQRHQKFCRIC